MGKKKKGAAAPAAPTPAKAATKAARAARRSVREERRSAKMERRKRERKLYTADMWAEPAPQHLVAKLDAPKLKSKYHSYFEFAENTEKKKKKLEFQVTDNPNPPPGFKFIPIGDPTLTNACKELSREREAMIFIVSGSKEVNSKISEHIYRTGYHFREVIVDEARELVGETIFDKSGNESGLIEPIPESQDEINKQADGAIRDLFPRIPNTDRQLIIEHAFQKGILYHGEPTVGLQATVPLSRRVQLAVLAHIRHTHTRYDKLLKETSWINARKVVEPVCLDVLVKWRGDEETGRDQMDEILREVVVITDSEDDDDSSEEEDSSEDDGEVTSTSSSEGPSQPTSRQLHRPARPQSYAVGPRTLLDQDLDDDPMGPTAAVSSRLRASAMPLLQRDKKAQRGFKRYQAAWDEALSRREQQSVASASATTHNSAYEDTTSRLPKLTLAPSYPNMIRHSERGSSAVGPANPDYEKQDQSHHHDEPMGNIRPDYLYSQQRTAAPKLLMPKNDLIVRPLSERPTYDQNSLPRLGTPPYQLMDQRPSVVVRGSPARNGIQDMLVPSIETASSDAVVKFPVSDRQHGTYGRFDPPPESYHRRAVESQRQSPAPREVIIINDDSPKIKRRRLMREDDSGRFRLFAHESRDHSIYAAPLCADSNLIPVSSVPSRDTVIRRPRIPSQSSQGLYNVMQSSMTGPAGKARVPVYDAPESGYFTPRPDNFRKEEPSYSSTIMGESHTRNPVDSLKPHLNNEAVTIFHRRPVNEKHRVVEPHYVVRKGNFGQEDHIGRHSSPDFPVSSRISRSYEMNTGPAVADQAFINSFSPSRLEPPLSQTRDGFIVLPERSRQNFVGQRLDTQRYEDHSARSFTSVRPAQEIPPLHRIDRSMPRQEGLRQSVFHELTDSHTPERYLPLPDRSQMIIRERLPPPARGETPTYVRATGPRRQLIVNEDF